MVKKTAKTTQEEKIIIEKIMPEMSPLATFIIAILILFILTLFMFADVLFTSKGKILSKFSTDLMLQFVYWRDFGFSQLRQGNLALWNPYIYSGAPYFGGFQAALLYPFNSQYLILPLQRAINFGIAMHVFLMGAFMYLWVFYRKLHPLACLLSAVMVMFGGTYFFHIFAGHLPNLCTMAWAPLIFLSIDGLFGKKPFNWCFLGIFAITMQILAGHPQYFYYTALVAFIYFYLLLIKEKQSKKLFLKFALMYIGAVGISAVQLLTGMQAAGECIRGGGATYTFASMFSFPPENLLTLLVPNFFNNDVGTYWGRCYIWEMSLFMSITGFILAVYGSLYGDKNIRRFSITMVLIIFILALGRHTPLFKILYDWLPGFNKFRGSTKFIFQMSLFISLLAGIGLDRIIKGLRINHKAVITIAGVGIFFIIMGILIRQSAADPAIWWKRIMYAMNNSYESYIDVATYKDINFARKSALVASKSLFISAITLLLAAAFLYFTNIKRKMVYAIIGLSIIELFIFARSSRATFNMSSTHIPTIENYLKEHPGDYRILNLLNTNVAMSIGVKEIWGNDPNVIKRYAQFITYTQGYSPDEATQNINFTKVPDIYSMLRCQYCFSVESKTNNIKISILNNPMPHLQLMQEYLVIQERDLIFKTLTDKSFEFRKKVILEETPDPQPIKSAESGAESGTVKLIDSSTDYLTIEADVPQPAILLITDTYSKEWRAAALKGSSQNKYTVMPANYVLQSIPLAKGHHLIRLEYLPTAYIIGKWISILSLLVYIISIVVYVRKPSPSNQR